MRVSIECPATSNAALRERARQVAEQLPARTPERRAAAACWVSLSDTSSLDGARRALRTFGSERTQSDAAALLDQLAAPVDCVVRFDEERSSYACSTCGTVAQP